MNFRFISVRVDGFFEQSNCWCHSGCHFFEAVGGTAILSQPVPLDIGADRRLATDLLKWNPPEFIARNQYEAEIATIGL